MLDGWSLMKALNQETQVLKEKCRSLRLAGKSLVEIVSITGVPSSTAFRYIRDLGINIKAKKLEPESVERRFMKFILDSSSMDICWLWTGFTNKEGYGTFYFGGRSKQKSIECHNWSYRHFVGDVPKGMQLDHICHDPNDCSGGPKCVHRRCANYTHLRVTSPKENTLRSNSPSAWFSKRTHCNSGHEYTEDNIRWTSDNARRCKICEKEGSKN